MIGCIWIEGQGEIIGPSFASFAVNTANRKGDRLPK
jgi:hypothetical protein